MTLNLIRVFIIIGGGALGAVLGSQLKGVPQAPFVGGALGLGLAAMGVLIELGAGKTSFKSILSGLMGILAGLLFAHLFVSLSAPVLPEWVLSQGEFRVLLSLAFGYAGLVLAVRKREELGFFRFGKKLSGESYGPNVKILDTSVIIDGRIADICEAGFLEGTVIIPQFILKELQHIADSSDPLKRNRGRRGLDILQRIQQNHDLDVHIIDQDFPRLKEVDAKLVVLAKNLDGKVITNDFNLNKVAELQGVPVLNINQLANAVKPVVLPGEEMSVYILKEGKEYGQGVAYLDDGTMVVVDHAKRYIGQHVDVSVTSVLQTTAGRMIFTKLKENSNRNNRNNG